MKVISNTRRGNTSTFVTGCAERTGEGVTAMDDTVGFPREKLPRLQGLATTSELEEAVTRLKTRRQNGMAVFALGEALGEAQDLVRDAKERDRLQSLRPPGC